jgi:uncharacterized protein with HEPN domain
MRGYKIRPFTSYVRDMCHSIEMILVYSKDLSFHQFQSDCAQRDAILYNFHILGEAVKHVPRSLQNKNKHIPWNSMAALRNDIVHEYFDPDDEIMWQIIQSDLSSNLNDLQQFLINIK